MAEDSGKTRELDLYEAAYLCGGVERVAMVALAALRREGAVAVTVARPRVTVLEHRGEDPVQRAMLDAVPAKGMTLNDVIQKITESSEIKEIVAGLRDRGLLRRSRSGARPSLSRRGRQCSKELTDLPPEGYGMAVLGVEGIDGDDDLRKIFTRRQQTRRTWYGGTVTYDTTPPPRNYGAGGDSGGFDSGGGGGGSD
ncbi:TIGR04222 domain-containing membrane protein [Spirillospora sp. CA-255316]